MTRFDDFPDDDFIETERQKKRPQKSSQEELEERIYDKRCQLVKLSHSSDYFKFLEFLRENENILMKMDDYGKECIRRTCQSAWDNSSYSSMEDLDLFNKLFGPYIDVRRSKRVPVFERHEYKEPKMTLEEEIAYRSRGSYYAMWDFITNPEFQDKLKGRTDLYDKVKYMIDRAKANNESVLPGKFKTYEPSDEEMYVKVLELMKE